MFDCKFSATSNVIHFCSCIHSLLVSFVCVFTPEFSSHRMQHTEKCQMPNISASEQRECENSICCENNEKFTLASNYFLLFVRSLARPLLLSYTSPGTTTYIVHMTIMSHTSEKVILPIAMNVSAYTKRS